MQFEDALILLKAGNRVSRSGWNGKGMFLYLVPSASYPAQTGAAKAFFGEDSVVPYGAYLVLKGADDVVNPWTPSQQDMMATDWEVL